MSGRGGSMRLAKKEAVALNSVPPIADGRVYLCVGPFCWGRAKTPGAALKNAQANRVKIYEGKGGWRWIMFDAAPDDHVDGMGLISYKGTPADAPRKLVTFNVEAD